jgi:CheY-like chemotaxis protein
VLLGAGLKSNLAKGLIDRIEQSCGRSGPKIMQLQPMTSSRAPAEAGAAAREVLFVPARSTELRALLLRLGAQVAGVRVERQWEREPDALRGRRVLVVEDNAVNQLVAGAMLESMGVHCVLAADGAAALAQLKQNDFDLVLMDCQMPGMDGFEATRKIRALEDTDGGRQAIVALTANAGSSDRAQCIDAGMDDFLTKPMTLDALRAVLRRWLLPEYAQASNS